jgi:hypothetical protein
LESDFIGKSTKINQETAYVACWEVKNKKIRLLAMYYVGTHEKAPY